MEYIVHGSNLIRYVLTLEYILWNVRRFDPSVTGLGRVLVSQEIISLKPASSHVTPGRDQFSNDGSRSHTFHKMCSEVNFLQDAVYCFHIRIIILQNM